MPLAPSRLQDVRHSGGRLPEQEQATDYCASVQSPDARNHPDRYLENVPSIVPLLEKEYRNAARRLEDTQSELNDLHPDK